MSVSSIEFRKKYGRAALITGGSEGLGGAFAQELAARGLDLVLVARRPEPLGATAEALRAAHGVEVTTIAADVGRDEGLARVVAGTEGREIGLFVHSAAVAPIGEFTDLDAGTHDALVALNCRAPALLVHRFGREMAARGRGGIVILSSLSALAGTALVAHYAASKAYQRVLAEGLWAELGPRGVDVLACLAGPTDTPTFRAHRPRGSGWMEWPPVMEPGVVARDTLAALGQGPVVVPGTGNGAVEILLRRLLPQRLAVWMMSASTRRMYRSRGG